jgi:Ran GTPase-activating protein (RanGAP) involved in mRNA processing and transport
MPGSRQVEKSQTLYVRSYVEGLGEKLVYLVWITKENKKKTGKFEDRLLAVTGCRVLTFKGRNKLCRNDHLYNLQSIIYQQEQRIEFHFETWFIKFSHPKAGMLVKYVCETLNRICCIWPDEAKPKIDANNTLLTELNVAKFDAAQDNGASGFLATYEALCSMHAVSACEPFKVQVRQAFLEHKHSIHLSWHGRKMEPAHVQAFAGTILHDTWFTDVSFGIMGLGSGSTVESIDAAAAAGTIGPTLSCVKHLQQLRFNHSRLQAKGVQCIVNALQANRGLKLKLLDLSHNSLNDTIVSELATCLVRTHVTLQELHLNSVNMTSRGFASMIDTFVSSPECSNSISVLTITHNTLGKRGTSKLLEYISSDCGSTLKRLDVTATGIDTAVLADALRTKTGGGALISLAVGENRLTTTSTAALCKLLSTTDTLAAINLSGVVNSSNEGQNKKDRLALEAVTATLLFNPHLSRSALKLASNMMDPIFGRKLAAMCRNSRSLVKLDISECSLGDETLAVLLQAYSETSQPRIEMLNIARNSRQGEDFGASKWLGRVVTNCTSLKSLDVSGGRDRRSNKNVGKQMWVLDLKPLFAALNNNKTIKNCNISSNGLNDADMKVLINALNSKQSGVVSILYAGNNITKICSKRIEDALKK